MSDTAPTTPGHASETEGHAAGWPKPDSPGRYQTKCTCGLKRAGTARDLAYFRRNHHNGRDHVVSIANGGQRIDEDDQ